MLSRVLVFGGALVVSGVASADVILGVQLGKQSLDIRQTDGLGNVQNNTEESDTTLGLVVGFGQPGGGNRIFVEWNDFSVEDDVDVALLDISYSYFLPSLTKSAEAALRPFIGGDLGYGWLDISAAPGYESGKDSNILYGVRTGLNLSIGYRAEVELGMRYTVVDLDADLDSRFPLLNSGRYEVKNSKAWWIGVSVGI